MKGHTMRASLLRCAVLCGLSVSAVGCQGWIYNFDNGLTNGSKGPIDDHTKVAFLRTYAPRVWLHRNEAYWPSSVEWSFHFLKREWSESTRHWWLVTKERLQKPSSVLAYFHGADPNRQWTKIPCSLDDVPAYAFWHQVNNEMYDLVYFFWLFRIPCG